MAAYEGDLYHLSNTAEDRSLFIVYNTANARYDTYKYALNIAGTHTDFKFSIPVSQMAKVWFAVSCPGLSVEVGGRILDLVFSSAEDVKLLTDHLRSMAVVSIMVVDKYVRRSGFGSCGANRSLKERAARFLHQSRSSPQAVVCRAYACSKPYLADRERRLTSSQQA